MTDSENLKEAFGIIERYKKLVDQYETDSGKLKEAFGIIDGYKEMIDDYKKLVNQYESDRKRQDHINPPASDKCKKAVDKLLEIVLEETYVGLDTDPDTGATTTQVCIRDPEDLYNEIETLVLEMRC